MWPSGGCAEDVRDDDEKLGATAATVPQGRVHRLKRAVLTLGSRGRLRAQPAVPLVNRQRRVLSETPRGAGAAGDRGLRLAVKKKLISSRSKPEIEKPTEDPNRVRRGFFSREQVDALCQHLSEVHADLVRFLFWSAWRVGEARRLEWKHYFRDEGAIRLPAEFSKNKQPRVIPVLGELASVIERRWKARRLDCARIFHADGKLIGDFRKRWGTACRAIGLEGRIVHDLRRSGVKHLIDSGVDPHTTMAFSGHRTPSMLRRYHIIDLDDLRRAAVRAQDYSGTRAAVTPIRPGTATLQPHNGGEPPETAVRS